MTMHELNPISTFDLMQKLGGCGTILAPNK